MTEFTAYVYVCAKHALIGSFVRNVDDDERAAIAPPGSCWSKPCDEPIAQVRGITQGHPTLVGALGAIGRTQRNGRSATYPNTASDAVPEGKE